MASLAAWPCYVYRDFNTTLEALNPPLGPEWAGQAFHPASASLFKAIGDQCIV